MHDQPGRQDMTINDTTPRRSCRNYVTVTTEQSRPCWRMKDISRKDLLDRQSLPLYFSDQSKYHFYYHNQPTCHPLLIQEWYLFQETRNQQPPESTIQLKCVIVHTSPTPTNIPLRQSRSHPTSEFRIVTLDYIIGGYRIKTALIPLLIYIISKNNLHNN